jgi:DNA-binding CsgD family transcriptional regulator
MDRTRPPPVDTGPLDTGALDVGAIDADALGADDWELLNALIGQVYECALDPARWDATLAAIAVALGPLEWDVAFLIWERSRPPSAQFIGATGVAAGVREIYAAVYAANNPWSRRIAPLRSGSVVDTDEIISREEFIATALYRDFLHRWNIERALAVVLDRRGDERLALVWPGPAGRDVDRLRRGLRVLAPHIQRAVRIGDRIAAAERQASVASAAADRANFAILGLQDDLTVVTANRRVAHYVDVGVIKVVDGRLRFADRAGQEALSQLAMSTMPGSAAFAVADRAGTPVAVLAARVVMTGNAVGGTALIVSIGGGTETPMIEISRVAAWFGLTPGEARLTTALAGGMSIVDYANARTVSVDAARFLLKGVFRKTGATSQAQLVGMVTRLPG